MDLDIDRGSGYEYANGYVGGSSTGYGFGRSCGYGEYGGFGSCFESNYDYGCGDCNGDGSSDFTGKG